MAHLTDECPNPNIKFDDRGLSIRVLYKSYRSGGRDNLLEADIRAFSSYAVKDLPTLFEQKDSKSVAKFEQAIQQHGHKGYLQLRCSIDGVCHPGVVYVKEGAGKGIGTKLYEVAAKLVCLFARQLQSDQLRSPYSEAFWRKQVAKGRAFCAKKNIAKLPNALLGGGVLRSTRDWKIDENREFKTDNPRIPKPERRGYSGFYWPCLVYQLKTPFPETLEGLRKTRSRSRARRPS